MLDPQAELALKALATHNAQAGPNPSPAQLRALYLSRRHFTEPAQERVSLSRDHRLARGDSEIVVREIRPAHAGADQVLPALIYLHGGGWMVGSIDSHDGVCRALINAAACAVFSVDHRLAPELPLPATHEDSLALNALSLIYSRPGRTNDLTVFHGAPVLVHHQSHAQEREKTHA